jgi:voltage-gated potassium channel
MNKPNNQDSLEQGLNLKHLVLMIIFLGLLLFRPLVPSPIVDAIFLPTIIVSAWLAGGKTRRGLIVTVIASLAVFGLLMYDLLAGEEFRALISRPLGFPVAAALLVLFIYCGGVILHSLLKAERVLINEVIGTFNMYLIMGYAWAYLYQMVEICSPGSFQPVCSSDNLGLRFIYFSFVTLTTVGFGDTVPASPLAQMLVVLEAIIGQFFVAVVVAYLVSMYIVHKLASKENDR